MGAVSALDAGQQSRTFVWHSANFLPQLIIQFIVNKTNMRRPQYGLTSLIFAVAMTSVMLAVLASCEHNYRLERTAVDALLRNMHVVGVDGNDPDTRASRSLKRGTDVLERSDAVVYISCGSASHEQLSCEELSAILCFPTLRILDLRGSEISEAQLQEIAKLRSIEDLDLRDARVSDDGIRHLGALRSLRTLKLSNTRITGAAFKHWSGLRHLEELELKGTLVDDDAVLNLAVLSSLRVLDLSHTRISSAALGHLSTHRRLEKLRLRHNDIGNMSLQHLACLPNLTEAALGETSISDAGLTKLGRSESLEFVELCDSAISDAGLLELAKIQSLRSVSVYDAASVTVDGVRRMERLRPDLMIGWDKRARRMPSAKELAEWGAQSERSPRAGRISASAWLARYFGRCPRVTMLILFGMAGAVLTLRVLTKRRVGAS